MVIDVPVRLGRIKNGYSATTVCPGYRGAAHGFSPEVAVKNLEYGMRAFFGPAQRAGTVREVAQEIGLTVQEDGDDESVTIRCQEARGG